ncbi:hypothetical protein AACH10_03725 [Ideonella sp. DXS22W]|uniref:MotA/TolQ/ExbB proton channel domain-containing protein n=1 Tax=Pseudaquabacterium inlustre TaxID=2984192 RepID=A0ABU9CCD5_9BURK
MNFPFLSGRRDGAGGRDTGARAAAPAIEPIWLEWLTLGGMLLFGSWLLGVRGVWALLLSSDPTGLTLVIIVVFLGSTLWCGARSRELQRQRALLATARPGLPGQSGQSWATEYLSALAAAPRDADAPADLLAEHTHGPHHTAWWVNGIQLKLGLLGKVIGFSVLALQIGNIQSFDPSQSQDLLKSLTAGLGIALLTTMVGLVGNILLGLQLTRLDRYADALMADIQRAGIALRSQQQG